MTTSLPRWVHRNLPRAAPPDYWQSLRSARVPPVHYLDKPLRLSLGATSHNPGVQFSMSKRVQFRMSVDIVPIADAAEFGCELIPRIKAGAAAIDMKSAAASTAA